MVKKRQNPLAIDYAKGIIAGSLVQVRNETDVNIPRLVHVWTIDVKAEDSKLFVDFVRQKVQTEDPVTFQHIKRIKKSENQGYLNVIVCSLQMIADRANFSIFMEQAPFNFENVSEQSVVPMFGPPTKELSLVWSELYWPLVWRGNPNDQILNDYVFDMSLIRKLLQKICDKSFEESKSGNKIPVVSAFVNPKNQETVFATDCRYEDSPLDHSIMRGIRSVAALEQKRKNEAKRGSEETYLCLDFDVYTTHEPCSMCAMALIHSRIKRCIYLNSMPETGCLESRSGDSYCMHSNHSLNSKYEVFRWLGDEFTVLSVEKNVCC